MERRSFDSLARLVARQQSRRSAVAAVFRAALLASIPFLSGDDGEAKRRRGGNGSHKKAKAGRRHSDRGDKQRVHAEAVCYPTTRCSGRFGAFLAKCDFGGSHVFANGSCVGCTLNQANLRGAQAAGVTFTAVNLSGACLVDADFSGGSFLGVNTLGAIFCRTRMPNGSLNNSGCSKGTSCCPTCDGDHPCPSGQVCVDGSCRAGDCRGAEQCSPSGNICEAFQCRCGDGGACSGTTPHCCGDGLDADCQQCCVSANCGGGETCCSGTCVPTSRLCGGVCGNVCKDNETCCGQKCVATSVLCGGACDNICASDQTCCGKNCEATDNLCGGFCGNICTDSETCCGDKCVPTNGLCGRICNNVCSPDQTCCGTVCEATGKLCGGICGNVCTVAKPNCCGQDCRECCADAQCTNPAAPVCLTFECVSEKVATTFARVRPVVADILAVDENQIALESEFIGDLGADSLDVVELIMALEEEFGITISDEEAENIRTVGDAVQFIIEHGG
jgi:acyl carrier protein